MAELKHADHARELGLALSNAQAVAVAADPDLARRIDDSVFSRVLVGIDALDDHDVDPVDGTTDPHALISFLSATITRTGLLAVAVPLRDHPYNIARRAGSLDLLTPGESGIVIGFSDRSVPATELAWGETGLGPKIPFTHESVADAIAVIDELWHAWPFSSIIADRENRIFVDLEQVKPIDHEGIYRVRGPLGAPSAPDSHPLLAAYVRTPDEFTAAHRARLLIVPEAQFPILAGARGSQDGKQELWVHRSLSWPETVESRTVEAYTVGESAPASIDGLLLSAPTLVGADLARFIDTPVP